MDEDEEYCLWPSEQSNKVERLARAEQQPCIGWKKYKIRVLGKAGTIYTPFFPHIVYTVPFYFYFLKVIITIQ